ncbi:hypothetical protein U0C82_14650 [Fulvimarina sp. 2208YS6-2-32]|uniref:Holin-X, holin superfamily III n=1 Tax=Fulvimarina uroteuthidis TaxID=3098149 RepID=A0ABU5I6E1_9HYPH|nr:hypothetical protein [Fulvimarina sp. 2208YS6-2-32]MDY8110379.1 hypothetical protein [Fulvimarina sp. 2208YS6-2-32]
MWFILAKIFQGELGIYFARLKRLAILYVIMAIFGILLLAFLITALFVYVATQIGPLNAALIASGLCLAVMVGLWITTIVVRRRPEKRAQDRMKRDIASVAGTSALVNLPKIFAMARKRKAAAFLTPVVALVGFGIWRMLQGDGD